MGVLETLRCATNACKKQILHPPLDLASLCRSCAHAHSLPLAFLLHRHILCLGLDLHGFLSRLLLHMYDNCGALSDAHSWFSTIRHSNVVSWNLIIRSYARRGLATMALRLFDQMQQEGISPDMITIVSVVSVCASDGALSKGRQLHAHAMRTGLESDVSVATAIVNMYGKCGSLDDAHRTFEILPVRDLIAWNAMIAAYAQHGHGSQCLELSVKMHQEGVLPDKFTFVSVLSACANLENLEKGKQTHSLIICCDCDDESIVGTALVSMYGKCGGLPYARKVFDEMARRDIISWNSMISGFAQHGHAADAFKLFHQMQWQGLPPNNVTFLSIINACAVQSLLAEGKQHMPRSSMKRRHYNFSIRCK